MSRTTAKPGGGKPTLLYSDPDWDGLRCGQIAQGGFGVYCAFVGVVILIKSVDVGSSDDDDGVCDGQKKGMTTLGSGCYLKGAPPFAVLQMKNLPG
jgi:hypothetical protein